jgi:hypothetical protein
LALIVPNVTIWATRSSPYFSVTYLMPRRAGARRVHVDVRHGDPVGVEEPLEDQAVAQWVGSVPGRGGQRPAADPRPGWPTDPLAFAQLMVRDDEE